MATNSNSRKRQQKSKSGIQNKVSNADNQRNRDQNSLLQRFQTGQNGQKNSQQHFNIPQNQKNQHQQQQQTPQLQRQQLSSFKTAGDATMEKSVIVTTQSLMSVSDAAGGSLHGKTKTKSPQDHSMALQTAVLSNQLDAVSELLKRGANPADTDQDGNNAFMTACRLGDVRLMSTLFDAFNSKSDLQHANTDGETALHVCAKAGHEEGCKFLLSCGADINLKSKSGDTPLHFAARADHVNVCQTALNFLISSSKDGHSLCQCVLAENGQEKTPVCLSILLNHAEVTRILLEILPVEQQAKYLTRCLQKMLSQPHRVSVSNATSVGQGNNENFLHGLLVSMSVLLIRQAEKRKREKKQMNKTTSLSNNARLLDFLTNSDIIQSLLRIACKDHINQQITTIASFLLVYLMERVSETGSSFDPASKRQFSPDALTPDLAQDTDCAAGKLVEQFLQCCGPDCLLLKLNNMDVTDHDYASNTMAIITPIVFLTQSYCGRSWLESNKSHLTFLKELLLQNKSSLALLTSTCPLLKLSRLEAACIDFVKLVEVLEDKDREKNLADLIWEEERDRLRRERKKQKRNQRKKQIGIQLKKNVTLMPLQVSEVTSEEEMDIPCVEKAAKDGDVHKDIWKPSVSSDLDSRNDMLFGKSGYPLDCGGSGIKEIDSIRSRFSATAKDVMDDHKTSKWEQRGLNALKENTPMSIDSVLETSQDADGEMRENSSLTARRQEKEKLASIDTNKTKSIGALAKDLRWADVAKLGCSSVRGDFDCNMDNLDIMSSLSTNRSDIYDFQALNNRCGLTEISRQDVADQNITVDNEWFDVVNHCQNTNSDNESCSSSPSSTESCFSLVSDSFLHTHRRATVGETISVDTDLKHNKGLLNKAACFTSYQPLLTSKRQRSNIETFQIHQKDGKLDTSSSYLLPNPLFAPDDHLKTYIATDGRVSERETARPFKLPSVGNSLHKSRSDDVLVDMSRGTVDKPFQSNLACRDKEKRRQKRTRAAKTQLGEQMKPELPAVLPPLNTNGETENKRMGALDGCANGEISNRKKMNRQGNHDNEKMNASTKSVCNDQSFHAKVIPPLDSIVSGNSIPRSSSVQEEGTASSSGTVAGIISNSSLWSKQTLSQTFCSTSLAPGLNTNPTPQQTPSPPTPYPRPLPTGSEPLTLGLQTNLISRHASNAQNGGSSTNENSRGISGENVTPVSVSKKSRVISAILLDNVQNPPSTLQKSKIRPLPTLMWNSSDDFNKSTIKYHQSKPETEFTGMQIDLTPITDRHKPLQETAPMNIHNATPDISARSKSLNVNETDLTDHCIVPGLCKPLFSNAGIYLSQSGTFSSLLMNRMEQRRHQRSSSAIVDTPEVNENKEALSHSVGGNRELIHSHEKDNRLSDILDSKIHDAQDSQCFTNHAAIQKWSGYDTKRHHHELEVRSCSAQDSIRPETADTPGSLKTNFVAGVANKNGAVDIKGRESPRSKPCREKRQQNNSPPVFFPEKIREQVFSYNGNGASFPAFHDVQTSDFLSEMFSDPLFSDKIAINQIRQKILSNHTSQFHVPDSSASVGSDIDLDYYASLYRMKFRDVLVQPHSSNPSLLRFTGKQSVHGHQKLVGKEGHVWQNKNHVSEGGSLSDNNAEAQYPLQPTSRWRPTLQKCLDLPWTTRCQNDDIVLPHSLPEFSIGVAGNVLIYLGFLIDGTEVAVFRIDKVYQYMTQRMVQVICDPEMDKHFLARCKSYSESSDVQYIAMDLFEYTLCEYLQVCLPECNQNMGVYQGLVWQLLQALRYLHHGLGIAHGCLAPCWVFINRQGNVRLAGFGIEKVNHCECHYDHHNKVKVNNYDCQLCQVLSEDAGTERTNIISFSADIHAAGILACYILSRGQYQFGTNPLDTEIGIMRDRVGPDAFDLICPMLASEPKSRPTVDQCIKHPIFWSGDKKFRLILIVGSDVLTEMKTGVALTGSGAPTMMEILSMVDISQVSPNWIHEVDGTVLKEMRSFRVYKNNLAELTLFVYNCCLHFDKLSNVAKEILDDPSKYFQNLFPSLFMAIYRSLKASDRCDRTCYKPFF